MIFAIQGQINALRLKQAEHQREYENSLDPYRHGRVCEIEDQIAWLEKLIQPVDVKDVAAVSPLMHPDQAGKVAKCDLYGETVLITASGKPLMLVSTKPNASHNGVKLELILAPNLSLHSSVTHRHMEASLQNDPDE